MFRPARGVLRHRPSQNFMLQLRKAGIEPVAEAVYRDHHAYTEKDIRELLALKAKQRSRRVSSPPRRTPSISADIFPRCSRSPSFR